MSLTLEFNKWMYLARVLSLSADY